MNYRLDNFSQADQHRFHKRYTKTTGCWLWQKLDGTPIGNERHYGAFSAQGHDGYLAHRLAWMFANQQDWPTAMPHARHTCNTTGCVNPAHIIPGTAKENANDRPPHKVINIANSLRKRSRKAVHTPFGDFGSAVEAAQALSIKPPTLYSRLQKSTTDYYYI